MKSLAVVLIGGMMVTGTGCLDAAGDTSEATEASEASEATEASQAEQAGSFEEVVARHCDRNNRLPNNVPVRDESGMFTTMSSQGFIDLDNEFFQDLGGNGRRCVSCHVPSVGWTITPHQLQETFEETDGGAYDDGLGLGAVFRTNDGANSPKADVSTKAKRRQAYSMLLNRGLVRVGLPVPANAEFELVAVDDPYHYASAAELSLFRRPLPTTNLKFDSTVMWDGREVVPGATVASELETQASDAVIGHAQGKSLTSAQRESIAQFETSLASAQIYDHQAKDLYAAGAEGGPSEILAQEFYIGINDNFGDSKTLAPFTSNVFTIFNRWAKAEGPHAEARRAIARGQQIFNSHPIAISGVSGINDEAKFGKPATLMGSCSSCHNTPNGGNHSVVAPLNIGLVDASRRTKDMPLYTLRNKTTGETVQVT
ncbi:MAG TPA: hypothetical protein VFE64_03645, partial [Devosia sp.]|nr:hypothetical protein [Devosia sp.]